MLYWLFNTYRSGPAFLIISSLLTLGGIAALFVGAYLLGKGGLKTTQGAWGPRQKRIVGAVQIIAALATLHLAVGIAGFFATQRDFSYEINPLLEVLVGPPDYSRTRLGLAAFLTLFAAAVSVILTREQLRDGGAIRELVDYWRDPVRRRDEMGSAHFCYPGDFTQLAKSKPQGLKLLGAFYGKESRVDPPHKFRRLDAGPNRGPLEGKAITFSEEDQARGMVIIGPPGTGKSQAGILPVIADTMHNGHSVIVADPQSELTDWVLKFATVTGHLVAIHDPTETSLPRYNLTSGIRTVADAQAIAAVMIMGPIERSGGDGGFWNNSAKNLLAGCLMRFNTLGDILIALTNIKELAQTLASKDDEARLLCGDFIHSALETPDQKLALNIASSLKNSALANWAAPAIREATSASDIDAWMLVEQPCVLVLKCPGRYRDVYGPYIGAALQKLVQDLDSIGEESGGPLPRPVKIVLDEFPALGRLDSVVSQVNLVRKRQISMVIAAQALSQLEMIYGQNGANTLLAGMATQIYFGSCDIHTAEYVSRMLGKTTERVRVSGKRPDGSANDPRTVQRDLMTADEVITPPKGNCTIIYRYATGTFATQIILLAHLTRMYEREDWLKHIHDAQGRGALPLLLERPVFERILRSEPIPQRSSVAPPEMEDSY